MTTSDPLELLTPITPAETPPQHIPRAARHAVTPAERTYLRGLARRQADYAALPVMAERRANWYALNDGLPNARPPVVIETGTFDHDFLPEGLVRCESELAREVEGTLLRNIRNHELIDDDKVIPDTYPVAWVIDIDELGIPFGETDTVADSQGVEVGFRYHHPFSDLATDLGLLRPAVCRVDREATARHEELIEDLLGDILTVERGGADFPLRLTFRAVELMGMEALYLAMYDTPGAVHDLMAHLAGNALRIMGWAEREGLLALNNANHMAFASSYAFTHQLPAPGHTEGRVRLVDLWGATDSQETVGISARMWDEFCLPYYGEVCEPFGRIYYGCCEPVHPIWESLQNLPHLAKVSISPWSDQAFMGEALRGAGIVFSRKPDPKYLGLDAALDEEAWAAHIRETAVAASGVPLEIIQRDVYTVHGDLSKAHRAVQIARRELDRWYRS